MAIPGVCGPGVIMLERAVLCRYHGARSVVNPIVPRHDTHPGHVCLTGQHAKCFKRGKLVERKKELLEDRIFCMSGEGVLCARPVELGGCIEIDIVSGPVQHRYALL